MAVALLRILALALAACVLLAGCGDAADPSRPAAATELVLATGNLDPTSLGVTATGTLITEDGTPIELVFVFRKRADVSTWDWCVDCVFDAGWQPLHNFEVITGGSGTVSFDANGDLVSWIHSDGKDGITLRTETSFVAFSINPTEISSRPGRTSLRMVSVAD